MSRLTARHLKLSAGERRDVADELMQCHNNGLPLGEKTLVFLVVMHAPCLLCLKHTSHACILRLLLGSERCHQEFPPAKWPVDWTVTCTVISMRSAPRLPEELRTKKRLNLLHPKPEYTRFAYVRYFPSPSILVLKKFVINDISPAYILSAGDHRNSRPSLGERWDD